MSVVRSIMTMFQFRVEGNKLASVDKQIGSVATRAKAADRQFNSMARNFNNAYRYAQAAVGVLMGSRVFQWLTKGYADTADQAAKQSKAIGITIEQYQELSYTSKLAGADIGVVSTGLQRMARTANDAVLGSKTAIEAFKAVGINPRDKELMEDQYGLLLRIADAFESGAIKGTKQAAAIKLLGRAGATLIPLLNEGSVGIRKYAAEARKLGLVINAEEAKKAEFYNDQMLRLKSAFVGIRNTLAQRLLPVLSKWITALVKWFKEGENVQRFVKWLVRGLKIAAAVLAGWITSKTVAMVKKFRLAILAAVRAVRSLGLAGVVAHLKLGLLLAGIAALVLLVEDLYYFATGGKSVIGELLGDSADAEALRQILLDFGDAWMELWKTLKPVLADLWKAVKPLLKKIWELIKPLIPFLGDVLVVVIKTITVALTYLADFIRGTIEAFQSLWRKAGDVVTGIIDGIRDAWNGVVDKVKWVIQAVKNDLRDAWDSLPGPVKKVALAIKAVFEKVFGWIRRTISILFGGIKDFLVSIGVLKEKDADTFLARQVRRQGKATALEATSLANIQTATRLQPIQPFTGQPMPRPIPAGGRQVAIDRRAHIGAVHLNVSGSVNMDAPETLEKVKAGMHDVLLETLHDAYADTKEPA